MVTDRGTPVAILSPVPSEIKLANQLADAGVARWTGKNFSPTPLSELPKRRTKKGPPLSEIVTREREESW